MYYKFKKKCTYIIGALFYNIGKIEDFAYISR